MFQPPGRRHRRQCPNNQKFFGDDFNTAKLYSFSVFMLWLRYGQVITHINGTISSLPGR
jgi:hypothetical protein